jgi:hypothetical protein
MEAKMNFKNIAAFSIVILLLTSKSVFSQSITINEIMSSNTTTIYDEDGDSSDWIELYNCSANQVNLEGYYLSDDSLDIKKWRFGNAVIEPGEYLIVFASDKDTIIDYWHTNFKISASGEEVILSDSSGLIIDQINVPASLSDVSYARKSDGSLPWIFQSPSPGSMNTGIEIIDYADTVSVSLPGGFYSTSISVELSAGESNIFYTLDGSDPDSSSLEYSNPINISETTVLKAISTKAEHLPSPVIYHSYFINKESDLPVVSLISDPYNLFDYNYGIYADGPGWTPNPPHHGANYWMDWERPAHIQFFDEDKNLGFSKNCGIEIYGGWTRSFPQKSFSVKFKKDYGSSALEYPLFPEFDITTFKSFILRNSGNDFQFTHIRDAMMQFLIKDLDIDYLEYRPAAAYINGEYWGIYNIREKISEHYVANRHGVDPDNIDMLEGNMEVIHGDSLHYRELVNYISKNDMSTDEAYNYVNSMIDLDNCLLYFAAQVYYNSQDWPANNLKYWRERSENGKWRWILFDLDFGFNLYETNGQAEDHVYYLFSGIETRPGSNPPWSTLLPRKLVENPTIKNKYINLIADLLNTKFKSGRVVNLINKMADHIASEGVKHRERWDISQFTFDNHIQRMISFAQERPGYLRGFVRNFFNSGLDGTITIEATEGGRVKLNSIYLEKSDLPWSGKYFMNVPIEVKAIANEGYKFEGWSGSVTSNDRFITLFVTSSTNLSASFVIDSADAKEIVINEINYKSADDFDTGDWIELYNRSNQSLNISDWFFSDSDDNHKFIFPAGSVLEPGAYLVLVDNDSAFTARFPDVKNYMGETGFGLNGSGEFMKLVNEEGQIIDSLTYDDNLPWPVEADGEGATLELIDAAKDNSVAENWQASIGHGTPGRVNSVVTSVEEDENNIIPGEFLLYQNYPNPFNLTTSIKYSVSKNSRVSLQIYDLLGEKVATLFKGTRQAGNYVVSFDGSGLTSGIYFYQLKSDNFIKTKKFLLIK